MEASSEPADLLPRSIRVDELHDRLGCAGGHHRSVMIADWIHKAPVTGPSQFDSICISHAY
jgi:RNase adaptor protein for sRNA GlmZ degradation